MKKRILIPVVGGVLCATVGIVLARSMNRELLPDYGVYRYTDKAGNTAAITISAEAVILQGVDLSEMEKINVAISALDAQREQRYSEEKMDDAAFDAMMLKMRSEADLSRFLNVPVAYEYEYLENEGLMYLYLLEDGIRVPGMVLTEEPRTKRIELNNTTRYALEETK